MFFVGILTSTNGRFLFTHSLARIIKPPIPSGGARSRIIYRKTLHFSPCP
jgi:hypothetical protein